jgi:hypothetical protein
VLCIGSEVEGITSVRDGQMWILFYLSESVEGQEVKKGQRWVWMAMGVFVGVMLLRASTHGIWAAGLLVVGGLIVFAIGMLSSRDSR